MNEIRTGKNLDIPGQKPQMVTYIDNSPGCCPVCKHPTSTMRLLVDSGVVTACVRCHTFTFRGLGIIRASCERLKRPDALLN